MKLVCPCCGATASAEAWANDAEARAALALACNLPEPMARRVLSYLGLFRPAGQALRWQRSARLLATLAELAESGHVQVQGKPARPCGPDIWARGMEQMAAQRERLSLPLKNHNYLRQIVWQLADQADAAHERERIRDERSGNFRANRDEPPPRPAGERGAGGVRAPRRPAAPPITAEERATLERVGCGRALERINRMIAKHKEENHAANQRTDCQNPYRPQ